MVGNCKKKSIFKRCVLLILSACVIYVNASDEANTALEFLIAETNKISLFQPHLNLRTPITSSNGTIIDVDYHYSKNLIFWIDGTVVYSANWDDANSTNAIIKREGGAWEPLSLAVDFLSDRIYIADGLGRKVDAFSLKGKNHIIVAAEDFERPSGIVLDPHAALMFVADSDEIIRMNLDGTSKLPIIRKTVPSSILTLTIDLTSKTLYWWDCEMHVIESSTYIGESRHVVHHKKFATINSITYFDQYVYFLKDNAIFRADDRRKAEMILQDGDARSIRAMDSNLQKKSSDNSPCNEGNGGCQHACVASASGSMNCKCYVENLLADDRKSCKVAKELLFYSHKEVIRGRGLEISEEIALSFAKPLSLSLSIDSDFDRKILYFADASNNTIYKGDIESGQMEPIVTYEGSASISVDWVSQNLYYADFAEGTLNVVSLRNYSYRKMLLDSLTEPKDVIVHPTRGHVYFYDDSKINRVNTDGTKLTTIYTPIRHKSLKLALDSTEERLYWCLNDLERASKNSTIQHSMLNGTDVISLKTPHLRDVSAMAVHQEWIYVIVAGYEKLMRLRKKDGKQMMEVATGERQGFYALAVMRQGVMIERNPCASATACDKLCFAVPRTKSRPGLARQCGCPKGERLAGKVGKSICKPDHMIKEVTLVHRCEPDWEFTCRNGRCIPKTQLCDGINDCLDRSDERGCRDTERNYFIAGG